MTEERTFTLNPNVAAMQPSATLAMTALAKKLKREGRPVIGLSAGEPDFDTPSPIAEAAIDAIRAGFTHYTENAGMRELREAICESLRRNNQLEYGIDQIVCSNGAKQSVALAVFAMCSPGDEVLIPAPYWVSYPEMVRMAGATPVTLPTAVDADYRVSADQLRAALTPRTRMLILCSPSNPTGSVYSSAELASLANVLSERPDVLVISDEIYEHIVYDAEHVSFATMPGMHDQTITVNGFSKGYAMTGWRLGYMAAPTPIAKAAAKVQGQFTSAPSSISQKAGLAALKLDPSYIEQMVAAFRSRRDFVLEQLAGIDGLKCSVPEGAFYVFPDVSAFLGGSDSAIRSSTDLCMHLLEEHNVALVPGDAFGSNDGLRISYAASMTDLDEAMGRLTEAFSRLAREAT